MTGIGSIRTREKCPVCHKPFDHIPRLGFCCPVHKTIPKTFYISVYIKGHGKFRRSVNSYKDGMELLGKINWEIKNHCFDPSRYVKEEVERFWICNLLDEFEKEKATDLAPSYVAQFRLTLGRIKDFFGTKDVRELINLDLKHMKDRFESFGLSPKTIKNNMDIFRSFVRWCRDYMGIEVRNATVWPHVDVPEARFSWLNSEDQKKIFEKVPIEDRPFIHFLMLHGCRPAEAAALKVKDVDLKTETIRIGATFSREVYREKRKGRGAKAYTVAIHPELLGFITQRVKDALPGAWLFENPRSRGYYSHTGRSRLWARVRKAAGLSPSLRLYDATRHSFASQQLELGTDIVEIKEMVGHTDIRTTMKYAHPSIEKMRANLEKLSLTKVVNWGTVGARMAEKAKKSK